MRFAAAVLALAFAGCATVKTSVSSPIPKGQTVTVISDRTLDDWKIHNLIIGQLQQRGFAAVDRGDSKTNPQSMAFRYFDEWRWDLVMYLHSMRVRLIDGKTGRVYSTADYEQGFQHGFPSSDKVVRDLFMALDANGAFSK
jgi:hypothetical protein